MEQRNRGGLSIGKRTVLLSFVFMFLIMIVAYVLTAVIPGGEFARTTDASGNRIIDIEAGFTEV